MSQPHDNNLKIARVFAPHVRTLNKRVEALRKVHGKIPYFDPCDGGRHAAILVLLESPGPSDLAVRFVSRDNPSPTQRNLKKFLLDAGIPRDQTVLWNTVPWIIRAQGEKPRSLRRFEIEVGLEELGAMIKLMTSLEIVVMAGRVAQQAAPVLRQVHPELHLYSMPHPSPLSVCVSTSVATCIRDVLSDVASQLTPRSSDQTDHRWGAPSHAAR